MHCYYHPDDEAAGICRNCGRGLCRDCIEIVEEAIACKGKCNARVAAIQRTIRGNQRNFQTTATQMRQGGIYALFSGALFVVMGGVFMNFARGDFGIYLGASFVALGLLLIVRGISAVRASRNYSQLAADVSDNTQNPTQKTPYEYTQR